MNLPKGEKPVRTTRPGHRTRKDNGPQIFEVKEAPPLPDSAKGTLHEHTNAIIRGSRKGAIVATSDAAHAFNDEWIAQWTLETPFIASKLKVGEDSDLRASVSAQYAMQWRPVFLGTVALAHSVNIGAKAAHVSPNTVNEHRKADPDFDAQVLAAQAYCIELLHSVTMRSALEGDIEPVYWQGIRVDWIRKFDNRLRVELLRAHMPATFKTPGSKVNVNTGNQLFLGAGAVMDQPAMLKLMEMRQISLARIEEKMAKAREVGTPALPPVPPMS